MRFESPPAGWYRLTSLDDPALAEEIRFTPDGATSLSLACTRCSTASNASVRGGLPEVARRIADASHRADHGGRVTLETLFSVLNLGLGLVLIARATA